MKKKKSKAVTAASVYREVAKMEKKTAKPKGKTRKVHIMRDWTEQDGDCFAFGKSGGRVSSTGYTTPWSAKRGAVRDLGGYTQRAFDKKTGKYHTTGHFMQDGTPIEFVTPTPEPKKHKK